MMHAHLREPFQYRRETGHYYKWLVRGAARLNHEWWRQAMPL